MSIWFDLINQLRENELYCLALEVEAKVCQLSGLACEIDQPPPGKLTSILKRTSQLLDQLLEQQTQVSDRQQTSISENPSVSLTGSLQQEYSSQPSAISKIISEPICVDNLTPEDMISTDLEEQANSDLYISSTRNIISEIIQVEQQYEPSTTAKELIKLRDSLLLAKPDSLNSSQNFFDYFYSKLGQILEQEGVITLDEKGKFNYECQKVISTEATDDPSLDETVCTTVRPGYIFHNQILRCQEVILFRKSVKID